MVSVKTTLCPTLPAVPEGKALRVAVTWPCAKEKPKSEPSAAFMKSVLLACPFASVTVVAAVTLPVAATTFPKVQLTVALGSGLPVESLTNTTSALKAVIGLVGQEAQPS